MKLPTLFAAGLLALGATAATANVPLYHEDGLGTQMSADEIRADLVGNSMRIGGEGGKATVFHVVPDGTLVYTSASGKRSELRWRTRDYDNLFCFDSGDPASSGCVQLLRQGNRVTIRRKDGLVEFAADIVAGDAAG